MLDLLLQLGTSLQKDISVVRGQRALQDYVRKSTGARLGLLFILDQKGQVLATYLAESDHTASSSARPALARRRGRRAMTHTRTRRERKLQASRASGSQDVQSRNTLDETRYILSTLFEQHIAEQQELIDQERKRIAREIHDGAAQQIAYAMYKLEFVQRILEEQPQVALRDIAQVHDILETSLKDLRRGIMSLIPEQLEQQGFEAALQALFKSYEPILAIRYDAQYSGMLPSSLEAPVFRFIQEALSNVHKHAQTNQVAIRVRAHAGLLMVEISDDGRGFLPEQVATQAGSEYHIGLRTMRERIQQAGGMLEIRSKPAEGTILKARFPLTTPAPMLTKREQEVLRLLVEGSTNRAIAKQLSVSVETVKSHVHHIMQKMHVKDRTQAAVVATRQHWL